MRLSPVLFLVLRDIAAREMLVIAALAALLAVARILELPPIAVAVLEIEAVSAVHIGDLHHLLDAVFLFVRDGEVTRAIDLLARLEIEAPVIADADRPHILALLEANEAEIAALSQHHRFFRVAHAVEAEEFLVERP